MYIKGAVTDQLKEMTMSQAQVASVVSRVSENMGKKPRWTYSLEAAHGETYRSQRPTLYGHSTYGRSSVLAGRPSRAWMEQWNSWEEARADLAQVKSQVKGFKYSDYGEEGGSSHIPVAQIVAHLPDDTDY
jgi:hypothetical protein